MYYLIQIWKLVDVMLEEYKGHRIDTKSRLPSISLYVVFCVQWKYASATRHSSYFLVAFY